jgi:DNA polymerase-3 subunit delta'
MHKKQWEFLKKSFEANQLAHAYLFAGQKDIGKKKFAKEFAEFIGCKFPDLMVVGEQNKKDPLFGDGGEIKISQIREVQNFLSYKSYNGGFKAVIVEDAEKMNQEAQSCLLKTLEEPKGQTLLLLVSSRPDGLLPTIFSRCQLVKFFGKPEPSQEKIDQENRIIQDIIKITSGNLAQKFNYAKSINFEEQDLRDILEAMQKHFRTQLLSRVGQDNESVKKLIKDIKLIEDINNKITFTNANPRLALEVLLMEL